MPDPAARLGDVDADLVEQADAIWLAIVRFQTSSELAHVIVEVTRDVGRRAMSVARIAPCASCAFFAGLR